VTTTNIKPNKFAGKCALCGEQVPAAAGRLGPKVDNRWTVEHLDCTVADAPVPVEATASDFAPTDEQEKALALFATGASMVIEAGAGTGKTSTLKLLAEAAPTKRIQYIAFNRAIVQEASVKFPANVQCNTAHSLAFRAVGKNYSHRLNASRMTGGQMARILGVQSFTIVLDGDEERTLAPDYLASRVMGAVGRFCQTADTEVARRHFEYIDGIDTPTADGHRTFANNDEVTSYLLPFARKAWTDLQDVNGALRFGHDHYLKMWQLSEPTIAADIILYDEAQDSNPVSADVVARQDAQKVYVGDSQQAIYEFTGAVNSLANIDSDHRVFLTQSFRFGQAVAEVANTVLAMIEGAELRLVGTDTIESTVGISERDDAILCRTNATAVESVINLQAQGRRPHLVGGGTEVVAFAKGARDLQSGRSTSHPELACFDNWAAVQHYVQNDAQGGDLKLLAGLVDKFGVETILLALDNMVTEAAADVIVSTAHKSKGREWDSVRLAGDFPVEAEKLNAAELRLIYVAVTRARINLDCSALADLLGLPEEGEDDLYDADVFDTDNEPIGEVLNLDGTVDEVATAILADRPRWAFLKEVD
jgi:superfamily I DNA/RNA helicase